jgi:hypothetical protein
MIGKSLVLTWILIYSAMTCQAQNDTGSDDVAGGPLVKLPDSQVESLYSKEASFSNSSWSIYEFTTNVKNSGNEELEDVMLVANLTFDSEKEYVVSSGRIDKRMSEPNRINGGLVWQLGTLKPVSGPDGQRTVSMKISSSKDISSEIKFYAIYRIGITEKSTVPVAPIQEVSTELD